jgi:hypothetical protein
MRSPFLLGLVAATLRLTVALDIEIDVNVDITAFNYTSTCQTIANSVSSESGVYYLGTQSLRLYDSTPVLRLLSNQAIFYTRKEITIGLRRAARTRLALSSPPVQLMFRSS